MTTLHLAPVPAPTHLEFCVRPECLTDEDVDLKVRETVRLINASGWAWTTWSCQGHKHEDGFTKPYLGLVTRKERLAQLLEILHDAAENVAVVLSSMDPETEDCLHCFWFEIWPEKSEHPDWRRFNVYTAVTFHDPDFEKACQFMHLAAQRIYQAGDMR